MNAERESRAVAWAVLLSFLVCWNATASAADANAVAQPKYGGGTGEPNDPYLIYTAEQMNAIGAEPNDWSKDFKLMADIDLSAYQGTEFNIIGNDSDPFTGVFDGNHKRIMRFHYAGQDQNDIGLFRSACYYGTEIRDLCLVEPNISIVNGHNVGSIVGYLDGGAEMMNCSVIGGTVSGDGNVGGAIGKGGPEVTRATEHTYPSVKNCCFTGSVSGKRRIGGFIGYNQTAAIGSCCAEGNITGEDQVGGLAGISEYGSVANCYAIATVIADSNVGGLAGEDLDSITNSYAAGRVSGRECVGGLVGSGSRDVIGCFWDTETSGQASSAGGDGKTTAEMRKATTFFSWNASDDEPIWTIDEGKDYPRLSWEARPGRFIEPLYLHDLLQGTGTAEDPYLIYTAEELNTIALYSSECGKHFKLMADIDLAAYAPNRFNLMRGFWGVFDGNHHVISNIVCHDATRNWVGLFAYIWGPDAEVRNLGLVDFDMRVPVSNYGLGSLVGSLWHAAIVNCYTRGVRIAGGSCVGGLIGVNEGIVRDCHTEGEVTGNSGVGGLVGDNADTIMSCCSSGNVTGSWGAGGLIGDNTGRVTDCYSTAGVSFGQPSGGLVGANSGAIINGYAAGHVTGDSDAGGLVGETMGDGGVFASFWDTQTSGKLTSAGGTGKTTSQLRSPSTFAGWGYDNAWVLNEGHDYPRLSWEKTPGRPITTPFPAAIQGTGSDHDPYLIWTAEQFNTIGQFPYMWDKHLKLVANIDLSAYSGPSFNMIGIDGLPFTGVFDGNGHTISNFNYSRIYAGEIGLWGHVGDPNAQIKNLGLINSRVGGQDEYLVGALVSSLDEGSIVNCYTERVVVSGGAFAGGLAGWNAGSITNCHSSGSISGGGFSAGGLVAHNEGNLMECSSVATVNGTGSAGGLTGANAWDGVVTACFSSGTVRGYQAIGGLSGWNTGKIKDCYSLATVSGSEHVAGLIGENEGTIVDCYSTGAVTADLSSAGLVAWNDGDIVSSFWDIQTSGQATIEGGIGKTTAEMKKAGTFIDAGWDFVGETKNGSQDIWRIDEGQDYPRLIWERQAFDIPPKKRQ